MMKPTLKTVVVAVIVCFATFGSSLVAQTTEAEWKQVAVKTYPQVGVKDSPLNKLFASEYGRLKTQSPEFFLNPKWPVVLAQRCSDQLSSPIIPGLDVSTPPTIPGVSEQKSATEGPSPTSIEAITAKLNKIILPKLECKDATVREIIDFLKQKSRELDVQEPDPSHRGVNIILKSDEHADAARITLSLTNVPVAEVLRYVTTLAGLKVKIDQYAVVVIPSTAVFETLITKQYKVPLLTFTGSASNNYAQISAKDYFTNIGVLFPPGSAANFNATSGLLIVKNTQEQLGLIDAIVEALNKPH